MSQRSCKSILLGANVVKNMTNKNTKQQSLSFAAKNVTKELLASLPDRARRVLTDRFGLISGGKGRTLEAIGKEYGITRERIRQIESSGIAAVRDSGAYSQHGK